MQRAAVYIRVSTEEQTEFSPDAQLRLIRQFADKNNLLIEDCFIFRDEGVSGRSAEKRPAFQSMIAAARSKPTPFALILVHKLDRFARSREDSIVYKSLLRKECGVKVVSITEQMEDDKFSVILEAMLEAMAEYYSLNLAEEVKKGMTEKARRGELQTPAPFGYRMIGGLLTPHAEESAAVRRIFEQYVQENRSLRAIAGSVNTLGFQTKKGNSFDARLIAYILQNPTYIGKMRWTPTGKTVSNHDFDHPDTLIIDGRHAPIVGDVLWAEANRLIRAGKIRTVSRGENDGDITTHWLRGVLCCGVCGAHLSFCKGVGGKQSAFRCGKYLAGSCAESQRITVGKIEAILFEALQADSEHLSGDRYIKAGISNPPPETAALAQKRKRLLKQLENAKTFALEGIDTPAEYKENKTRLTRAIDETDRSIAKLGSDAAPKSRETFTGIVQLLKSDNVSLTEKNRAIKEIVSKIIYHKKENRIELHYYFVRPDAP
ncbi:MAG: recombinase family protein [Clostridiales bacterium]|nr:recombinase family protein [Clostridiales bacterium]